MRQYLPLALILSVAISLGALAAVTLQVPSTEPDEVAKLADGVYFRHGDLGRGHCNNGFVVFEDFVLVVDANFPSGAEACHEDIREATDKPVRFVFDTHHHGDHAYGNPVWTRHGAVPVAHANVVREMARYEPQRWREEKEKRDDMRAIDRDTPQPPVVTFADRMVLEDSARRVELIHFGTAHTGGDGFAYLPREKILFTGDAVVNGPYNYMGDGNTSSWLRVLDALAELDVAVVAPGHGPCGDRSLIADQRLYIASLREAVIGGIAAGKSLEELQESVTVPERVERYVGDMFPAQIAKIYAEETGLEMPIDLTELGFRADPTTARGESWTKPAKIVFTGDAAQVAALKHVAPGVEIVAARGAEDIRRAVADADALIGGISEEAIRAGTKLRWVHSYSAGVEGYVGIGTERLPGIAPLVDSEIILTNGQRCYGPSIADHAFAQLLALTRQVKASIDGKKAPAEAQSRWRSTDPGARAEEELRGKTIVIVGVGGIGSEVARRAKGFGMRVIGVDPQEEAMTEALDMLRPPEALDDVLPRADVLVLSCPLTAKTRGLIGKEEFARLPDGAYLINVARGRIVDHDALVAALESGRLAGAGLDVTEPEPLPDGSPLWDLDNVVITPHNAGQSSATNRRVFLLVRENVRRFAAGEPLLSVVGKERGY